MIEPLIKRLENFQPCTLDERCALKEILGPVKRLQRGQDVFRAYEKSTEVNVLLEGWATRYKMTKDGHVQTLAFLLPGDLCNIHVTLVDRMDHSLCAITPATFASITRENIEKLYASQPRLSRAFFWSMLVDESILREWLVNIGSRSASKRVAHLFCELLTRAWAAGLTDDHSLPFPITQQQLGDAMGITSVHTSRVLTYLRNEGLVCFHNHHLDILDWARIKSFAEFEPAYLHLANAAPAPAGNGSLSQLTR